MAMIWRILVAALVLGSLGCFSGKGSTPLHNAAFLDASAKVETLLKQGANVNARGYKDFTPLDSAIWEDASATAEVLRRYGARRKYGE